MRTPSAVSVRSSSPGQLVQFGERGALVEGHEQVHRLQRGQEAGLDRLAQLVEPGPLGGRHLDRVVEAERQLTAVLFVEEVDLVEGEQPGGLARPGLAEHLVDGGDHLVQLALGDRGIGHVHDQIRPQRLLERGREGLHELVGQLANEADGVGEQVGAPRDLE